MNNYCYCWEITPTQGDPLRYTTSNRPLTFLGEVWQPEFGVNGTVIQKNTGLGVDNLELSGGFSEDITFEQVNSGYFNEARVRGYRVNVQDPTDYLLRFRGNLGQFEYNKVKFRVEVRSRTFLLSKSPSDIYTRNCPYSLGDNKCGVDLTSFSTSTTIESVGTFSITVVGALSDSYSFGRIVYPDGKSQLITKQEGRTLQLWEKTLGEPGQLVTVQQGCNKTRQVCKSKFNNIENFGGFGSLIPPDEILTTFGVPGKDVFDGSSHFERLT